jgi:uncharacterized membrane protein
LPFTNRHPNIPRSANNRFGVVSKSPRLENSIHIAFEVSLILKGCVALLETLGGIVAYFVSMRMLLKVVTSLTADELAEEPNDLIASYFLHLFQHITSGSQQFISFYLVSHGLVKLLLVTGLYLKKLWCYPVAIAVFFAFIAYQLYRYSFTHSEWLLLLTILDGVVIWLTWHEFTHLKNAQT